MFILDSDHMSLLEWGGAGSAVLRERLADHDEHEIVTTIVSYEEQVRGWMAFIAKMRTPSEQVVAYRRLRNHLDNYRQIPTLDYDERAAKIFQSLRGARIRIGTMDLKIASIVLAVGGTLLSRNLRDFSLVRLS
jgi:tRNA(fMet)-specific endonuclease VapC